MEKIPVRTDPADEVRRWVIPGESRVYVLTFGCQQNEADSERLLGLALSMGYGRADTPEDVELCIQKGAVMITANDPRPLLKRIRGKEVL